MQTRLIKISSLGALALASLGTAEVATAAERAVSLTQEPLVMRLSKDEFRIAFGINAGHVAARGCDGVIHYRVDWRADDGTMRSENRAVTYSVPASADRTITVDRQFFDTAEGRHTTDVVNVSVDSMSCVDGADAVGAEVASAG